MTIGDLRYLYVGTADTGASVEHYTTTLGGRLRWRFQHFGADVAAIELGDGRPLVLLADHRPTGSVLPLWVVEDLDVAIETCRAGGAEVEGPAGTPDGPVIVVHERGGTEIGFIRIDRPDALDGAWQDHEQAAAENDHRVR